VSGLRTATADYLARLDREISEAEQAIRQAKPDTNEARQARASLDGRIREWNQAVAWVWSVTATHAALAAAQAEVRP